MRSGIKGIARFQKGAGNPIDILVGQNVKLRRTRVRMSQTELANHLGITFQQVQKYEKGTNRIGAGRLYLISLLLDCDVQDLYEGIEELVDREGDSGAVVSASRRITEFVGSRAGTKLCEAASLMKPNTLGNFVRLARAIVGEDEEASQDS